MHVSVYLLLLSLSVAIADTVIEQDDEEDADVVEDGDLDGDDDRSRPLLSADDCTSPPETGFCRAAFINWYYDPDSGTCKTFTYGGCGGNNNNFETEEQCRETCSNRNPTNPFIDMYPTHPNRVVPGVDQSENEIDAGDINPLDKSICSLPAETGMCRARHVNWYYDASAGTCQTFIYGGCGGNANNFQTEAECLGACNSPTAGGHTGGQGNAGTSGFGIRYFIPVRRVYYVYYFYRPAFSLYF